MSGYYDKRFYNTLGLTVAIFVVVFLIAYSIPKILWGAEFVSSDNKEAEYAETVEKRTQPDYLVATADTTSATAGDEAAADDEADTTESASAGMSGHEVFDATCHTCHATGLAGAPKVDDHDDWASRLEARGLATLHKHGLEGFNAMPPRGGNSSLSDEEVEAAVDYMLSQAGVN